MKAGFAKAKITPSGGKIVIAGAIPVRYTDTVHDDVYANALVLSQGDTRTIWVSCDMCHPTKRLTGDVICRLKEVLPDFRDDELILSTTHATACFYLTDDEFLNSAFDVDYDSIMSVDETRRQVCEGIVSSVMHAISDMKECSLEFSAAEILTGYCRRVVYKDNSALMYGDVNRDDFLRMEYPDSSATQIIYFYTLNDHKLFGIFAAVPCPAQADENAIYITSDYWGVVREMIADKLGENVGVVGVCRSAGELTPHRMMSVDACNVKEEWGRHIAQRCGANIAEAIIRQIDKPLRIFDEKEIAYSAITTNISFPVRKPDPEQIKRSKEYFADNANFDKNGEALDWQAKAEASHVLNVIDKDDYYIAASSVLKIGDLLFFTCPAELFCEYAKRIAAQFPQNPVFDIQLTGDSIGYLPTKEAVAHGGYSTQIFSTVTTPDGGEVFVEEITAMLRQINNLDKKV